MRDLQGDIDYILLDGPTIAGRIAEMGRQIAADYADCEDLLLVCVLKGAFMFLADLSRALDAAAQPGLHGYLQLWQGNHQQRCGADHHGPESPY